MAGVGQYPAVEGACGEHRDAMPLAAREQAARGGGVKQRVAAGHEHAVQVGALDRTLRQRWLVHADADRPDHSLAAELVQGGIGAIQCLFRAVVRVVDERDVDAVGVQPPQAALQRGESAVPAVVAHAGQLGRAIEALCAVDVAGRGQQPAADFSGKTNSSRGLPARKRPMRCSDRPTP